MREAEIAALTDAFFEPAFSSDNAVAMLGSPIGSEVYGDRTVTYLRPDARALSRVDVFVAPARSRGEKPFLEEVVLALRVPRVYSRASLEQMLGPSRKAGGPVNEDGQPSWQLEFPQQRELYGLVMVRWWPTQQDPPGMGDPRGGDEVRADEIHFRRFAPGTGAEVFNSSEASTMILEAVDDVHALDAADVEDDDGPDTLAPAPMPGGAATAPPPAMPRQTAVPAFAPPTVDIDDAMDTGAWVGDIVWRILRPDFAPHHVTDLLGVGLDPRVRDATGVVPLAPRDPRIAQVTVELHGGHVVGVRLDAHPGAPLYLAVDAVGDRLNATPHAMDNTLRFEFEATRANGVVTLIVPHGGAIVGPIVAVEAVEVLRG